jgi:hypothetical protein
LLYRVVRWVDPEEAGIIKDSCALRKLLLLAAVKILAYAAVAIAVVAGVGFAVISVAIIATESVTAAVLATLAIAALGIICAGSVNLLHKTRFSRTIVWVAVVIVALCAAALLGGATWAVGNSFNVEGIQLWAPALRTAAEFLLGLGGLMAMVLLMFLVVCALTAGAKGLLATFRLLTSSRFWDWLKGKLCFRVELVE